MNKENSGVVILNANNAHEACKTVIVLGVPRGGTSMVAGTLSKLGVFMGEPENLAPFYENTELSNWLKTGDKAKITEIISKNNSLYPIWGIKVLPQKLLRWLLYRTLFSQVAYVVVFRDILAIAKRRAISMNGVLLKEMLKAVSINFCLLMLISFTKKPILLVSYEKALLFPEGFVAELSAFLNLNDTVKIKAAVEFIKPSPTDYRIRSTTCAKLNTDLPYFGYIDVIATDKIAGWALLIGDTRPLEIELRVNGVYKQTAMADLARSDVLAENPGFHENCGFILALSTEDCLKIGDKFEVRISQKNIHLINSPQQFAG